MNLRTTEPLLIRIINVWKISINHTSTFPKEQVTEGKTTPETRNPPAPPNALPSSSSFPWVWAGASKKPFALSLFCAATLRGKQGGSGRLDLLRTENFRLSRD